ncbi:unnamed protein product [Soboliphyme baturini]|uniref:AC_N domain-containing protein n=1 Tax=Soboliphyme baturini TaxID=241478 RepID=A0A183J0W5_9BILA|nr:unnamed protein product [Soboliphyme baturini]
MFAFESAAVVKIVRSKIIVIDALAGNVDRFDLRRRGGKNEDVGQQMAKKRFNGWLYFYPRCERRVEFFAPSRRAEEKTQLRQERCSKKISGRWSSLFLIRFRHEEEERGAIPLHAAATIPAAVSAAGWPAAATAEAEEAEEAEAAAAAAATSFLRPCACAIASLIGLDQAFRRSRRWRVTTTVFGIEQREQLCACACGVPHVATVRPSFLSSVSAAARCGRRSVREPTCRPICQLHVSRPLLITDDDDPVSTEAMSIDHSVHIGHCTSHIPFIGYFKRLRFESEELEHLYHQYIFGAQKTALLQIVSVLFGLSATLAVLIFIFSKDTLSVLSVYLALQVALCLCLLLVLIWKSHSRQVVQRIVYVTLTSLFLFTLLSLPLDLFNAPMRHPQRFSYADGLWQLTFFVFSIYTMLPLPTLLCIVIAVLMTIVYLLVVSFGHHLFQQFVIAQVFHFSTCPSVYALCFFMKYQRCPLKPFPVPLS